MNHKVSRKILQEKRELFAQCWMMIMKEEELLNENFNVARNLACSKDGNGDSYDPDRMDFLWKNYHKYQEKISRKKYFLIKTFGNIVRHRPNGYNEIVKYWDEEFKKENPELENRFSDLCEKGK